MSSFLQPFRMTLFQTLRMASFLASQLGGLHHAEPIAIGFQALLVLVTLAAVELRDLCRLEQALEYLLVQRARTLQQRRQVADSVQPLVEHRRKLRLRLRELRHLQVDERQLVVEHLAGGGVHQFHLVVVGVIFLVKTEVQDADGIDALQAVVPLATGRLLADGEGGVVHATILEELLLTLLHLHQEMLTLLVHAIYVEHRTAVVLLRAQVLRVQVGDLADLLPPVQQGVQEADEQLLVRLRAEQSLEREVGVKIDVSLVNAFRAHSFLLFR